MTECLYPVLRTWVLEKSKLPLVISTPAVTSTSLLSFLWVSPIRIVNLGLEIDRYMLLAQGHFKGVILL